MDTNETMYQTPTLNTLDIIFATHNMEEVRSYLGQYEDISHHNIIKYAFRKTQIANIISTNLRQKALKSNERKIPFEIASSIYQTRDFEPNSQVREDQHAERASRRQVESRIVMVPNESDRILSRTRTQSQDDLVASKLTFLQPKLSPIEGDVVIQETERTKVKNEKFFFVDQTIQELIQCFETSNHLIESLLIRLLENFNGLSQHLSKCINKKASALFKEQKTLWSRLISSMNDSRSTKKYFSQHNSQEEEKLQLNQNPQPQAEKIMSQLKKINYNPDVLERMLKRMKIGCETVKNTETCEPGIISYKNDHKSLSQPETNEKTDVKKTFRKQTVYLELDDNVVKEYKDVTSFSQRLNQLDMLKGMTEPNYIADGSEPSRKHILQTFNSNKDTDNSNLMIQDQQQFQKFNFPFIQVHLSKIEKIFDRTQLSQFRLRQSKLQTTKSKMERDQQNRSKFKEESNKSKNDEYKRTPKSTKKQSLISYSLSRPQPGKTNTPSTNMYLQSTSTENGSVNVKKQNQISSIGKVSVKKSFEKKTSKNSSSNRSKGGSLLKRLNINNRLLRTQSKKNELCLSF